jgi:hypothetical protein
MVSMNDFSYDENIVPKLCVLLKCTLYMGLNLALVGSRSRSLFLKIEKCLPLNNW